MSMENQSKFEGWAVVEIMGHNKEIGYVTTEYFGGPALFRVDQPSLPEREYELKRPQWLDGQQCPAGTKVQRTELPGKTVWVGPPAIFRMTPCTEETARRAIEELIPVPIKVLSMPEHKQLVAAGSIEDDELAPEWNDPDDDDAEF